MRSRGNLPVETIIWILVAALLFGIVLFAIMGKLQVLSP